MLLRGPQLPFTYLSPAKELRVSMAVAPSWTSSPETLAAYQSFVHLINVIWSWRGAGAVPGVYTPAGDTEGQTEDHDTMTQCSECKD